MAKKNKKVQVPSSIRNKMMAATSMLLVSAILMVTTSYAWFTLSTAPEVTGITTSVGANGNLEMALLTTETFANTELITSNTGDSMETATKSALTANITWGNLVDLSDDNYGLKNIKLYPAAANITETKENENTETETTVRTLNTAPLSTPTYGADGRVNKLEPNTISAVYNVAESGSAFTYNANAQTYGARAVGTASSVTPRELAFKSAKGTYAAKVSGAASPMVSAVRSNVTALLGLAAGSTTTPTSYSATEVAAMKSIAAGVQSTLRSIVSAYANAGLAKAASDTTNVTDENVELLRTFIGTTTSASELKTKLETVGVSSYSSVLAELADAQTAVDAAINTTMEANDDGSYAAATVESVLMGPLLGAPIGKVCYAEDFTVLPTSQVFSAKWVSLTSGAVNTVAKYIGVTDLVTELGVTVTAGDKNPDTNTNVAGTLAAVTTDVNALPSPTGDANAETNITDTYGYILDFAFRTNAASSNLQLQTAAVNRVYDDAEGANLATQGAGSTVTFSYPHNEVTADQAKNLLKAVRLVFFDPDTGIIYKTAMISDVTANATAAKGSVYIIASEDTKYTLGKDAYTKNETTVTDPGTNEQTTEVKYVVASSITVGAETLTPSLDNCTNYYAELTEAQYDALRSATVKTTVNNAAADKTAITALDQNTAKKVSVLVYLDGENIDNAAVANGETSGDLKLNLQFSSSATLVPMENSALKNMEKSTTTTPPVQEEVTEPTEP